MVGAADAFRPDFLVPGAVALFVPWGLVAAAAIWWLVRRWGDTWRGPRSWLVFTALGVAVFGGGAAGATAASVTSWYAFESRPDHVKLAERLVGVCGSLGVDLPPENALAVSQTIPHQVHDVFEWASAEDYPPGVADLLEGDEVISQMSAVDAYHQKAHDRCEDWTQLRR